MKQRENEKQKSSSVRKHLFLLLAHDRVNRRPRQQREPRHASIFSILLHQKLRGPSDDIALHFDLFFPGFSGFGHRGSAREFLPQELAGLGKLDPKEVEPGDGGD